MPLKTFTTTLSGISQDAYVRNDEKYHSFLHESDWNLFDTKGKDIIKLKELQNE